MKQTGMAKNFQLGRVAVFALVVLATVVSSVSLSVAADHKGAKPLTTLTQLKGSWAGTLYTQTGCGLGSTYFTFTLDANGNGRGTATQIYHTVGCGDGTSTSGDFAINSLNANGSGTAGLSCGAGCGFAFAIQVSKNHQVMNLVDVTDPNNFLEGTAIHQ